MTVCLRVGEAFRGGGCKLALDIVNCISKMGKIYWNSLRRFLINQQFSRGGG